MRQVSTHISRSIAEFLSSLLLTCIIVDSDSPHGSLFESGGLFKDGGLYVGNHLEVGGLVEGGLNRVIKKFPILHR